MTKIGGNCAFFYDKHETEPTKKVVGKIIEIIPNAVPDPEFPQWNQMLKIEDTFGQIHFRPQHLTMLYHDTPVPHMYLQKIKPQGMND